MQRSHLFLNPSFSTPFLLSFFFLFFGITNSLFLIGSILISRLQFKFFLTTVAYIVFNFVIVFGNIINYIKLLYNIYHFLKGIYIQKFLPSFHSFLIRFFFDYFH